MQRVIPSILAILLTVAQAHTFSQVLPGAATDVTSAEIQAALKKAVQENITDQMLRLVDIGKYNLGVALVIRRPPGPASKGNLGTALSHDAITEVYYILRGSGTQVTGGSLVDAKPTKGSLVIGPSMTGPKIEGGRASNLGPGDVQIIPPGVPHMWSSVGPDGVDYLIVRVDPDHVLAKK